VIDFHCHLDLYQDPRIIRDACVERQLYVLSVTTTPSAWRGTRSLAGESSRIRTALGLHPQIAHKRKSELELFERLLPKADYVGEVGLDGSSDLKPYWDDQLFVFARVLEACREAGGRVLSIHSRRAATAVLDLLEAKPGAGMPILHWFSGSQRELTRACTLGCWFSVGPAMLSTAKGRALAARMPRERVLTESDGPFAQLDGRAVLPWDVGRAVDALADVWRETRADVQQVLGSNLRRLGSHRPRSTGWLVK
jgi:TatD DNase family protein